MVQNNDEIEKNKSRLSKIKIILIVLGILLIGIIIWTLCRREIAKSEEENYKIKAENYLEKLYEKDFILEKDYIGYESKTEQFLDGTLFKWGKDKNIKKYCYLVHPVDEQIYTYVTVLYRIKENEVEIFEGNNSEENKTYLEMKDIYDRREKIIEYLKPLINPSYKIYAEEKKTYSIIIETNEMFEEKLKKDINYYEQLLNLIYDISLDKTCIEMTIYFYDGKIYGNRDNSEMISYISFGHFNECDIEEVFTLLKIINKLNEDGIMIKEYDRKSGSYIILIDEFETDEIKNKIKSLLEEMENKNESMEHVICLKIFFNDSEYPDILYYSNTRCWWEKTR